MKSVLLNKITNLNEQSITIKSFIDPQAYTIWHHHNEFEILYFTCNSGTAFIGDSTIPFAEDTLILLSKNLPHKFAPQEPKNNPYYEIMESYVLHFSSEIIHSIIDRVPEFRAFIQLLKLSERGLLFKNKEYNKSIRAILAKIHLEQDYHRMTSFFDILSLLVKNTDYQCIASSGYIDSIVLPKGRLKKIYEYTSHNFKNPAFSLDEIAECINMNKSAFCRYFKNKNNKTFSQFLNEIRISHACKLLIENDNINITDVAFNCGYNNMSNFNRQFKVIMGLSPSQYIKIRKDYNSL